MAADGGGLDATGQRSERTAKRTGLIGRDVRVKAPAPSTDRRCQHATTARPTTGTATNGTAVAADGRELCAPGPASLAAAIARGPASLLEFVAQKLGPQKLVALSCQARVPRLALLPLAAQRTFVCCRLRGRELIYRADLEGAGDVSRLPAHVHRGLRGLLWATGGGLVWGGARLGRLAGIYTSISAVVAHFQCKATVLYCANNAAFHRFRTLFNGDQPLFARNCRC